MLSDGRAAHLEAQERRIARWVSPLLSATAGQVISAAQLLGEEEPTDSPSAVAKGVRQAEKRLAAIQRKLASKQKRGKLCHRES